MAVERAGRDAIAGAVFRSVAGEPAVDGEDHDLVHALRAGIRTLGVDAVIRTAFGDSEATWSEDIHDAVAVIRALAAHIQGGPTQELRRVDPITALLADSLRMG